MKVHMRKLKVGETLFLVTLGNKARWDEGKPTNCIVTKVGRKYFYIKKQLDSWYEIQFYIKNWKDKVEYGSHDYAIYENRQAWESENKVEAYRRAFRRTFDRIYSNNTFSLDQLTKAAEILGIKSEAVGVDG